MAWTASGIFGQTLADVLENTTALDATADSFKCALFNNSVTPDFDAAAGLTAYNGGTWLTANEVTDTNWPAGGIVLPATVALTVGSPAVGQLKFDSGNPTASSLTMSSIYGCLIYDDTLTTPVADQGFFAVYFSTAPPYSVTNGTLTLTVDANGWFYVDFTP